MNRTFSILLSVYWTLIFSASAWMAAQVDGVLIPGESTAFVGAHFLQILTQLGQVLGNTLVAVLFTWTLVVSLLDPADRRETAAVAQMACSGAIAMLVAEALHTGFASNWTETPSVMTTVTFLAVLATHLVLRPGDETPRREQLELASAPAVGPVAALRIADAAHTSFVSRLADTQRPGMLSPANDDRSS